jgi:uncharacterized membrane protein (UPF0127 family)
MREGLALLLLAANVVPPPQHLRTISVRAPKATLVLQVARTEDERERGLMSVTKLAPHTGMLFVFASDALQGFWMKDTLVPLDMVFISADGSVRRVFADVPVVPLDTPDDRIPRRAAQAKYVIELPAGEAAADGIAQGTRLPEVAAQRLRSPSRFPNRSLHRFESLSSCCFSSRSDRSWTSAFYAAPALHTCSFPGQREPCGSRKLFLVSRESRSPRSRAFCASSGR